MRTIHDLFSDNRLSNTCPYCGGYGDTRDHVPSKALLDRPFPNDLPIVFACKSCNEGFSIDEEYVACFLDCVLNGSTSVDSSINERTKSRFVRKPALQQLIEQCKTSDSGQLFWQIDEKRFKNVIAKLAKGHVYFENGEPVFGESLSISYSPIIYMTNKQIV